MDQKDPPIYYRPRVSKLKYKWMGESYRCSVCHGKSNVEFGVPFSRRHPVSRNRMILMYDYYLCIECLSKTWMHNIVNTMIILHTKKDYSSYE
jgi:transposase-like protein